MKKKQISIVLGIVCLALTIAILAQMRTVKNMKQLVGTTLSKNSELIDEVLSQQEKYDVLYEELQRQEAMLEIIRAQATAGSTEDAEIEKQLKENNKLLGFSTIKGEGIVITLDDNRNVEKDELNPSQYLVHEEDLLNVINELFNAGADAISVNGNRIVMPTSILCDGNIIRVNGKIITVPVKIKAICSPAIYNTLIRPNGYLKLMANEGVFVKIESSEDIGDITIPKYDGVYNYSHLTRGEY